MVLSTASSAHAAVFGVNRTHDAVDTAPGDGLCADALDGGCSLRAALMETNALAGADRIELPTGVFVFSIAGQNEDDAASGDLDVRDAVDIVGAGSALSIVDAQAIDRMIELHQSGTGTIRLTGLTLRNGRNDQQPPFGSAVGIGLTVRADVAVQLDDIVIRDQRSTAFLVALGIGNAGCLNGERVRILDNTDPSSSNGSNVHPITGGIFATGENACLNLVDFEIARNDADQAGALYAEGGATINFRRGLIAGNRARAVGAMLLNAQNQVLLENVTVSGNRGNGAILNDGGSMLRLVNSTVTRNVGLNGTPTVGGIHDVHLQPNFVRLSNSIVSGNGPGTLAHDCNFAGSDGGNVVGDSVRCNLASLPTDRFDIDPGLTELADLGGFTRVHAIGAGAIDFGVDATCPATDQRGQPRPIDGNGDAIARCDIGAYEAENPSLFADGFE
jgi:hypothetical protein